MSNSETNVTSKRRPRWEWFFAFFVAMFCVAMVSYNFYSERKIHKENILRIELLSLRNSLMFYKVLNKTSPEKLIELTKVEYSFPDSNDKVELAKGVSVVNDKFIDPFGSEYLYDSEKTWVRSAGKRYENW